jgi:hypothetical protein
MKHRSATPQDPSTPQRSFGPPEIEPPSEDESSRIVARPDGYYWVADDGRQEFGPFPSASEALYAMRSGIETGLEPDASPADVEAQMGVVEPMLPEDGLPEQ